MEYQLIISLLFTIWYYDLWFAVVDLNYVKYVQSKISKLLRLHGFE